MECIDILGVKISKVSYESAIERIESFLTDGKRHQIVTPNPEFVVLAQSDRQFCKILNQADLAIPDGVGLQMAAKFLSTSLPQTVTGTDLMLRLCELAAKKGYSVFLLGGRGGVAEKAAKRLKTWFANLNIVGTYEGDPGEDFSEQLRKRFRTTQNNSDRRGVSVSERRSIGDASAPEFRILRRSGSLGHWRTEFSEFSDRPSHSEFSGIDFLFVAYGAPNQEKWIARNLDKIPVKVAMGVGGAFDFIAGERKRAPKILRRLGLEWLWRLVQEPQRFPRILSATIKFPLLVFLHKLTQNSR